MKNIEISLNQEKVDYRPGEAIQGQVTWSLNKIPSRGINVRLVWYTKGIGTRDVGVAVETALSVHREQGGERFSLIMPGGPFSFSGQLITLQWMVEASVGKISDQVDLVLSSTGQEVRI